MTEQQYHHGDLKNALLKAGAEILLEDGIGALSLRKAARRVGVSHAAPYAHFADKQALIAAISVEGLHQLYDRIQPIISNDRLEPAAKLLEIAHAYVLFAQESPAFFKLMFSAVLENEAAYPDFVAITRMNFELLKDMVQQCQAAGVLPPGDGITLAASLQSLVHGFTCLLIENQFSHTLLERQSIKELLAQMLNLVIIHS